MVRNAQTVKYRLFWREVEELAARTKPLQRQERDIAIETFIWTHPKRITFIVLPEGTIGIEFDRNMFNYFKRNDEDGEGFKLKVLECCQRLYGSGREIHSWERVL
jgi:hypothetical protein